MLSMHVSLIFLSPSDHQNMNQSPIVLLHEVLQFSTLFPNYAIFLCTIYILPQYTKSTKITQETRKQPQICC